MKYITDDNNIIDFIKNNNSFKEYFLKLINEYHYYTKKQFKRDIFINNNLKKFTAMRTVYSLIEYYIDYKNTKQNLKELISVIYNNEDFSTFFCLSDSLEISVNKNFFKKYFLKISFMGDLCKGYFLKKDYFLISVVLENIEGYFYMNFKIEEEYYSIR